MTTKDKQYSIYIRSSNLRVPCTKEQFDDYYRDINAYRRTQMNHGRCVCPPSKRLHCDMDCLTCPYHTNGDMSSLDDTFISNEGEEHSYIEILEDTSPMIDGILADSEWLRDLFIKLNTLMPEAIEIGKLREEGLSEDSIAKRIGVGRKTYAYRLKKVKKQLEEEFPELF